MESDEKEDRNEWVFIETEEQLQKRLEIAEEHITQLNQKQKKIIKWASRKGQPKVYKMLGFTQEIDQLQSNFAIKHGASYALEQAVHEDNLNFIKLILSQTTDPSFKAEIFSLAALHGKRKTTSYLAHEYPDLFKQDTLGILYDIFLQAIHDRSLRPLETIFESKLNLKKKELKKLIEYGITQAIEANFTEGKVFLETIKLHPESSEVIQFPVFLNNTL